MEFEDEQLLRYSRQIMLPDFGIEGQERLAESRVLIIGLGGLGSPAAIYLAAAGVGTLVLVDDDVVDLTNLQRQIVHGTADIDRPKVASAAEQLHRLNPDVRIETIDHRLEGDALLAEVRRADCVVDATDNFDSRFAINAACVEAGTALISGAAIRLEGQVAVFPNSGGDTPCYRCLYREAGELPGTCSENGVLAPVVGIIGAIQATETIKWLTGLGEPLTGRLLLMDAATMEWRTLRLPRDPACPVCGR